ncbi:sulfotransferase [Bradyrhizobium frederickii]|uniref:sulfotransferase n=1 Tax=Bradyrhizobium frederickii TaxID=2560054 RepID=UPI001F3D8F6A|nr:sulfotransferase [Bradyrhizobium frederickii]
MTTAGSEFKPGKSTFDCLVDGWRGGDGLTVRPHPVVQLSQSGLSAWRMNACNRLVGEGIRLLKLQAIFISGLPRAGSTLLSAVLRRNPRFRAGMTGPVDSLVDGMLRNMSMSNESAIFITDKQRRDLIKATFSTYYADLPKEHVAFDTNRNWWRAAAAYHRAVSARQGDLLRAPHSLDIGFGRALIRKKKYQPSGIFNFELSGTVYSRVEGLAAPNGMVGFQRHSQGYGRRQFKGE